MIHTHYSRLSSSIHQPLIIIVQFFRVEVEGDDVLDTYISSVMERVTTNKPDLHPEYVKAFFNVPGDTDLLTLKSLIFEAADKILEHQHAAHSSK